MSHDAEKDLLRQELEAVRSAAEHERHAQKDWRQAYGVQAQRLELVEKRLSSFADVVTKLTERVARLESEAAK